MAGISRYTLKLKSQSNERWNVKQRIKKGGRDAEKQEFYAG
jgi:hypothetical protein